MLAGYILGTLGAVFLILAVLNMASGRPRPQTRTWLLVGGIFALVSLWLFSRA